MCLEGRFEHLTLLRSVGPQISCTLQLAGKCLCVFKIDFWVLAQILIQKVAYNSADFDTPAKCLRLCKRCLCHIVV